MTRHLHFFRTILLTFCCFSPPCTAGPGALEFETSYDAISTSKLESSPVAGQEISYHQWQAQATFNCPITSFCGLRMQTGWEGVKIEWDQNPRFNEQDFHYINIGVGGYTYVIPDWRWIAMAYINIDSKETSTDYMLYKGLLWGKFCYDCHRFCEMNFHFGLIGSTGLEKSYVLPILGFDLIPWDPWVISIVFPIDMSVSYNITEHLTARVGLRAFRHRHRVADDEPISKAVFEYRSVGTELAMVFNWCWIRAEAHLGYALEGDLKVMNRRGQSLNHYKDEGAGYGGGSITLSYWAVYTDHVSKIGIFKRTYNIL